MWVVATVLRANTTANGLLTVTCITRNQLRQCYGECSLLSYSYSAEDERKILENRRLDKPCAQNFLRKP